MARTRGGSRSASRGRSVAGSVTGSLGGSIRGQSPPITSAPPAPSPPAPAPPTEPDEVFVLPGPRRTPTSIGGTSASRIARMHRMVAVIRDNSRAAVRNRNHYDPNVEQLKKRMASLKAQLRQLKFQHKNKYLDLMAIEQKINETATKIDRLKDEGRALGYGLAQFESGQVDIDVTALAVDDVDVDDDDIVFE